MATSTLRAIAALIIGAVLLAGVGCRPKPSNEAAKPSASKETTVPSSVATSAAPPSTAMTQAAGPSGSPATTTTTPAPSVTPKPTTPSVQLGPIKAAVSWAYLKNMYKKNGVWYVVVDYIQVVGPEETIHFKNTNPLLRTFPLSSDAKLLLLKSPGSPDYKSVSATAFKTFQSKPGDEVVEVTPKGGYAAKLMEWWAP